MLVLSTSLRALAGFSLATVFGTMAGVVAGYHPAIMRLARPQVTLLIGVPPIAWIVLLMIWFGMGAGTVVATAAIAALPLVFVGAAEGIQTRDRALEDMARMAGLSPLVRLFRYPCAKCCTPYSLLWSWHSARPSRQPSWPSSGQCRRHRRRSRQCPFRTRCGSSTCVDPPVGHRLISVEYGIVQPLRAEAEAWREAAQPWGVRR